MEFTFVHAADLHLDSPLRGLAKVSAPGSLDDLTLRAFERVVSLCIEEKAKFLLLAGDLYDFRDRSVHARLVLRDQLERLHRLGIRTFIVHGNHDPLDGDSKTVTLPESVVVFDDSWREISLTDSQGKIFCRVQGVSYATEVVTENLTRAFFRQGPEFTIGLLHANVGSLAGHENYAPCSLSDLALANLDYWALGHVHTRATYQLSNGSLAVYPGNSQGRHINETGPRGCMVVKVRDRAVTTRFAPTHVAQWEQLRVDISGIPSVDGLIRFIEELGQNMASGLSSELTLIVRVILEGRGPLFRELKASEGFLQFQEFLRQKLAAGPRMIHLESVRNHTRSEVDRQAILRGGGLLGALGQMQQSKSHTQLIQELLNGTEELAHLKNVLVRHGIDVNELQGDELLDAAFENAIELLVEDAP